MRLVPYSDVQHLIPTDCFYSNEKEFSEQPVLYVDGDYGFPDPLNLDLVDEIFLQKQTEDFIPFILIGGNATFGNIFNHETDGSTGLVVLGSLSACNIAVGGQEIYVSGDLLVNGLYWGDYNHGDLIVHGKIRSRVFLSTDYGYDYKRFQRQENIEIEHVLTDEQDDMYEGNGLLRALFIEKLVLNTEEILDEIYSWKDWFNEPLLLEALERDEKVLLDEWNTAFLPKEEDTLSFFVDNAINQENLFRFGESNILQPQLHDGIEELILEYWEDKVFRRAYRQKETPLSTAVYLQQDEDFACMIYMGVKKSLLKKAEYIFTSAYKNLTDEKWQNLDANAPEKYRIFLEKEWKEFILQFSQMHHWWNQFIETVKADRIRQIIDLPLIREKYPNYDDKENAFHFASFQWYFRPKRDAEDNVPRITIRANYTDDAFDIYHLVLTENGGVEIRYQAEEGKDAEVYEIGASDYEHVRNVVRYFEKIDHNIDRLNEQHLNYVPFEYGDQETVKINLQTLSQLCVKDSYLPQIENFLNDLFTEELDEDTDPFDELMLYCEDQDIPFLIRLDWKAEQTDLTHFLNDIIRTTFDLNIDLDEIIPKPNHQEMVLDIALKQCDQILRQHGLQIALANDFSDMYIIFVHETIFEPAIKLLFEHFVYEYQDVNEL